MNQSQVSTKWQENEFEFDLTQQQAIDRCLDKSQRVVPVTGEAGTGKTTLLRAIYHGLTDKGFDVGVAAPTGKAAKRITEATGIPAETIHRMLEYPFPGEIDEQTGKPLVSTDPRRDRRNPLPYDCVLVDEYTMVNVELDRNLLDALPSGGIIRMFGDANQLQPIEQNKRLAKEPCRFLHYLDKFNGIRLGQIHRQNEGSIIIENGHKIINGVMPKRHDDYRIKFTEQPVEAVLEDLENIDYTQITNQIICPTKVGWVGTKKLNGHIQSVVQDPTKDFWMLERHNWDKDKDSGEDTMLIYVGDKVVFTRNNYGIGVFNGETGKILEVSEVGEVVIDFGDRVVSIPPMQEHESRHGIVYFNPQKDIDLAYAITTHRSQGSEYDNVMYVMNKSRSYTLNRKNFYTGQSRARKSVYIVTDQKAMQMSLARKGDK